MATFSKKKQPDNQPIYSYINGMLKISDANFESGNKTKLFYWNDLSKDAYYYISNTGQQQATITYN